MDNDNFTSNDDFDDIFGDLLQGATNPASSDAAFEEILEDVVSETITPSAKYSFDEDFSYEKPRSDKRVDIDTLLDEVVLSPLKPKKRRSDFVSPSEESFFAEIDSRYGIDTASSPSNNATVAAAKPSPTYEEPYYEKPGENFPARRPRRSFNFLKPLRKVFTLWRHAAVFVVALSAAFALWHGYDVMSRNTAAAEHSAARDLVDISMALAHAQLTRSDDPGAANDYTSPLLLKAHYDAVLPDGYRTAFPISSRGILGSSKYKVNIITNSNLSHYALLATPSPSPMQSIFPKASYLLDSTTMILHKVSNVKAWEDLFNNTLFINASLASDIAALAKKEPVITLSSLDDGNGMGFAPPESLAIEHPGAKNVVYNAPRFFPFSTAVLKEVTSNIFPSDSTVYDNEAASFISKNLASRNDTVLYMPITTKKGYETYLKLAGHPALKGFIMGHLTFDSTSKKITRSALVEAPISSGAMLFIDDDTIDIAMPSIPSYDGETTALNVFEGEGLEDENAIIYRTMMHEALAQLVKTRHASLNIISEDIVALLASYNRKPFEDFDEQYSLIEQRYKEEALTHHNIIEGALEKFFASYVKKSPYENFPVFKTVVESMSLHDYVSNSLYNDLNSLISDSTTTMSRVPHP